MMRLAGGVVARASRVVCVGPVRGRGPWVRGHVGRACGRAMSTAPAGVRTWPGVNAMPRTLRGFGTATVKLADIGEGIASVEVLAWHVQPGAEVEEMDVLCQVQSDKAAVDISSQYTGVLKRHRVAVGDIVPIGALLCDIEVEGEGVEEDIEGTAEEGATAEQAPGGGTTLEGLASVQAEVAQLRNETPTSDVTKIELTAVGRAMHKEMMRAWQVPQFSVSDDWDVTPFLDERARLRAAGESAPSLTAYIIKALSDALHRVPILNSRFVEREGGAWVEQHARHNVSVAIDTPHGLLVPNLKSVEQKEVHAVGVELRALAERARAFALRPADLAGGTLCVSNTGAISGRAVTPVPFDGQAAIVGLGALRGHVLTATLSCDHRHIDGATAAKFNKAVKDVISGN